MIVARTLFIIITLLCLLCFIGKGLYEDYKLDVEYKNL